MLPDRVTLFVEHNGDTKLNGCGVTVVAVAVFWVWKEETQKQIQCEYIGIQIKVVLTIVIQLIQSKCHSSARLH